MKSRKFKKLLRRYQQGEFRESDSRLIDAWYEAFEDVEIKTPLDDPQAADRIHRHLRENLQQYIHKPAYRIHRMPVWRYAAIGILLLGVAGLFYYQLHPGLSRPQAVAMNVDTIQTAPGQFKKVMLPDSSVIWMNAGSTVRYEASAFKQERKIYLDRGEAFFSVTGDARHPFVVHTPYLSTTVLGTSFNISTYEELDYASITVREGRISVNAVNTSTGRIVAAGEGVLYHKASGILESHVHLSKESGSWVNGTTVLQEASFKELALFFYNRFQLRISSSDATVLQGHYTINILQHQSPDGILKLICAIHNNHYRRENNEIIIY